MNIEGLTSDEPQVWSVSQLNRRVGQLLQGHFSRVWVRGEISNFTQAASGHWYFSIKDGSAMVRAVMFRSRAAATGLQPRVGDQFEFLANVTLYEARGDYQLQVESLRRAGRGDLHEAFLRLKDKLVAEGLFEPERKRPIASMPKALGVVTSLAAAALRDVLTTLQRRAPHVPIIVYPAAVQGRDAAPMLIQALQIAVQRNEVDTLLLVRGGGSIEDLWSFNDEALARAVSACPLPVICGVGHETDFTICDFVADVRAPTPTAAAELACRDRDLCLDDTQAAVSRLGNAHQRLTERLAIGLDRTVARLVSPQQRLQQRSERFQLQTARLARSGPAVMQRENERLKAVLSRLSRCTPTVQVRQERLGVAAHRMATVASRQPQIARQRIQALQQALQVMDPRQVLARGYAIIRNRNQDVIKNALDLSVRETLSVEFDQGTAQVTVLRTHSLL